MLDHQSTIDNKDLDTFNKELSQIYPSFKDIVEAYPLFFKHNDSLRGFLEAGAIEKLHNIDNMEEYRRALVSVSLEETPLPDTEDESYSDIGDEHYAYEPSAKDTLEKLVGLKQRNQRSLLNKYNKAIRSLYSDGKLDRKDINYLDKLRYDITYEYTRDKISEEQYNRLGDDISISYREIFTKEIDLLDNISGNDKIKLSEIIININDTYTKGKLNNEHYTYLKRRISVLFEEALKEKIDSLTSLPSLPENDKVILLERIKDEVSDAYSKEMINELQFIMLKEKLSNYEKNKLVL